MRLAVTRTLCGFRYLAATLLAAAFVTPGAPAAAELRVQLSRTVTGRYESVGITVTDPLSGLDVKPGPLVVTMADSLDHRESFSIDPTGRPGEWYGRFTPLRTGRYTGTVILDRESQKDIGLVPLVRVQPSSRPGFLTLRGSGSRTLAFSSGDSFFPIGVRLETNRLSGLDWKELLARFRSRSLNYLAVSIPLAQTEQPEEERAVTRAIDSLLAEAERHGRPLVQIGFDPEGIREEALEESVGQVERWVRRWSYSPSIAAWEFSAASPSTPASVAGRMMSAARKADRYGHLMVSGRSGEPVPGADIALEPSNWQSPSNRRALMMVNGPRPAGSALPGEDSWQMLVLGGIGLPLIAFNPDRPSDAAELERLGRLAEAVRTIPFHAGAVPLPGVVAVDTPGSFCRYGQVLVGWMVPEKRTAFDLPSMPRGRYRVRIRDAGSDAVLSDQQVWSDGAGAQIGLPAGLAAVFVQAEPVMRTTSKAAAQKPVVKKPVAIKPVAKKPVAKKPAVKKPAAKKKSAKKPVVKKSTAKKKSTKRSTSSHRSAKSSSRVKSKKPSGRAGKSKSASRVRSAKKKPSTGTNSKKSGARKQSTRRR